MSDHATPATARARTALAALVDTDRPEAWISVAEPEVLLAAAADIDEQVRQGADLPLAGTIWAVKDNIDVVGFPTTAACPDFAYEPDGDAEVVARIRAQGGLILGKTNMDQFATGLVGTRSPYGAVRCVSDPELVSGGSSSGSAVAVAQGIVDYALGTDTAGSGRVPAGFNRIVGVKPTLGLLSSRGVVPACRSYDTVSLFAPTLESVPRALGALVAADPEDPRSRPWPVTAPPAAPGHPRILVPSGDDLQVCSAAVREGFDAVVQRLRSRGMEVVPVSVAILLDVARLLYDGALVAERAEAFGAFAASHPGSLDPTVGSIVARSGDVVGWEVIRDQHQVLAARRRAEGIFAEGDALLVPTAPLHPTIAAVQADPLGVNSRLGTFTNFVNLLDLCAVAAPARDGTALTVIAPAFHDQVALDVAAMVTEQPGALEGIVPGIELAVFGAHQRGLPLQYQLDQVGARFLRADTTSADYRMHLVPGAIPRPAVTQVASDGRALPCEVWRVSPVGLASLLQLVAAPLALGPVLLGDDTTVLGFVGGAQAGQFTDITDAGGWRAYCATVEVPEAVV